MDVSDVPNPPRAVSSRIPALEGLRGLAAMIVLVSHLVGCFAPHFTDRFHEYVHQYPSLYRPLLIGSVEWLFDGHYAVWVFWVMSAIVLALRYYLLSANKEWAKARRYLQGAAIRRYPRLVIPIFGAVLIGYFLRTANLMPSEQAAAILDSDGLRNVTNFSPTFLFALQESFFTAFYQHDMLHTYNASLWTMHAELIGSLFVFLMLGLFGRYRWQFIVYGIIAVIFAITHFDYLNGFLCGMVMCDWYVDWSRQGSFPPTDSAPWIEKLRQSRWVTIVLIVILLILVGQPNDRQRLNIILSVITCAMALFLPHLNRWLSNRVCVYLGKISFGVYLVHIPLLTSFSSIIYLKFFTTYSESAVFWIISAITIPVALLAGHLFHQYVDEPAIKGSRWFQDRVLKVLGK